LNSPGDARSHVGAAWLGRSALLGAGAGDRGGAAGYPQPAVDVLQVLADGAFGDVELPGELRVGVTGRDEIQELPLPGRELGAGVAAAFGVAIGLVQVGAQQGEQRAVRLAEVTA
jgi:hypothetical protein